MHAQDSAPGKPGATPTWCSSRKDFVFTGLGSSQVWATLGQGILNEVYWPSTGRPQIRDLGFIVAKEGRWHELKRLNSYSLSTPKPYVLLPSVRHVGDDFVVSLEFLCDDLRDVVLVRYQIEGEGHRLFTLLTPRLDSHADKNSAWCEKQAFFAAVDGVAVSLRATNGFRRMSAGYVGASDGWQDFHQHGEMTWEYPRADSGNVAVMGELADARGVIALAFASTASGADTLARSSLADGFDRIQERVYQRWIEWGENWDPPTELDDEIRGQVQHCTAVLKTFEDRLYPGAVVASLSIPWGESRRDLGGYHLIWPRDAIESALGMIAVGEYEEARKSLIYLQATQSDDGHWVQNYFPDGETFYNGIQLDETALPIILATKLRELEALAGLDGLDETIYSALSFLLRAGPVSPQDRWERNEGINAFTLGVAIAAMVGGADFVNDSNERAYLLSYADYLNRRIEDWLFFEGTELARKYKVDGHYIWLAPSTILSGDLSEVPVANGGQTMPAQDIVGLEFLYLARMGLRQPTDPRMIDSLRVAEGELCVETPNGPSFYRYNGDGYGEHDDGSPYDGTGKGRLWPLLTGERGHFAVQRGEDPERFLRAMIKMTGPGGLIPEQVWDAEPISEKNLFPGKPTGSAMPLLWAHAELVKLATVAVTGEPIELLQAVKDRYQFQRPSPSVWHWRTYVPFQEIPAQTDLLVEAPEPFDLHLGFDAWDDVSDRPSSPLGFGMHGVRVTARELSGRDEVNLTLCYLERDDSDQWEGQDHSIRIARTQNPKMRPTTVQATL